MPFSEAAEQRPVPRSELRRPSLEALQDAWERLISNRRTATFFNRRCRRGGFFMAERSFAREVEDLKLGEGEEFRGEVILAITKALLQSGVSYVGGYQGAPISHLMDVLADAKDVLDELGVHFESSASEATAAATLAASVHYPLRGA